MAFHHRLHGPVRRDAVASDGPAARELSDGLFLPRPGDVLPVRDPRDVVQRRHRPGRTVRPLARRLLRDRRLHHGDPDHRLRRAGLRRHRSEEHTSELQSLMRISYAVFCLKKKKKRHTTKTTVKYITLPQYIYHSTLHM